MNNLGMMVLAAGVANGSTDYVAKLLLVIAAFAMYARTVGSGGDPQQHEPDALDDPEHDGSKGAR